MSNLGASLFKRPGPLAAQPAPAPINLPGPPVDLPQQAQQQAQQQVVQQPNPSPVEAVVEEQVAPPQQDRASVAKDNIIRIYSQGGTDADVDQYLKEVGISDEEIKAAQQTLPFNQSSEEDDRNTIIEKAKEVAAEQEDPDAGVPEISDAPIGFWESIGVNLKLGTTLDSGEKAKIIEKHFQDDERFGGVFQTPAGNPWIKWEGQPYLVNKPGVSQNDFTDLIATATQLLPAAKIAGMARSFGGRLLTGIPVFSATSVAQQFATAQAGGKENIDLGQAGVEGVIGGVAEATVPPALKLAGRVASAVTPEPVKQALRTGANAVGSAISKVGDRAAAGVQAARQGFVERAAAAETQGRVRLTKGQAERGAKDVQAEGLIRSGAKGVRPQRTLLEFDEAQLTDIENQARRIKARATGNPDLEQASIEVIAEDIQLSLIAARDAGKAVVKELFDKARSGGQLVLVKDGMKGLNKVVQESVKDFDKGSKAMADVNRHLKVFRKLAAAKSPGAVVAIKGLEQLRSRISTSISKNADSPADAALIKMKSAIDGYLDEALESGLLKGDEATLNAYRAARSEFSKQASIFKGGGKDAGGNAMVRILDEKQASPAEVANLLVGFTQLADKAQTNGLIKRIKDAFPPIDGKDSAVVGQLKDAVLLKAFLGRGERVSKDVLIKNALTLLKDTNNTIGKTLFNATERKAIAQLVKDVRQTLPKNFDPKNASHLATVLTSLQRGNLLHIQGTAVSPVTIAQGVLGAAQERVARVSVKNLIDHANRIRTQPLVPAGAAAAAFGFEDDIKKGADALGNAAGEVLKINITNDPDIARIPQ